MKETTKYLKTTILVFSVVLALFTLGMTSCERDSDLNLPLAINGDSIILNQTGGATHIMIYSDGNWNVAFDHTVDWGGLNVLRGTGNSEVVFSFSENLEAARRVKLYIENGRGRDSVLLIQQGETASLKLATNEIDAPKNTSVISVPFTTNLEEQLPELKITTDAPETQEMITNAYLSQDHKYLKLHLAENTTGEPRTGKVYLTFTDGLLKNTQVNVSVNQSTDEPTFAFSTDELVIARVANTISTTFDTNLTYAMSDCSTTVTYTPAGEEWVSNVVNENGVCTFDVTENQSGANRQANIQVTYDNGNGVTLESSISIVQYTIEKIDLRLLVGGESGSVTIDNNIIIDTYVISDAGNGNMETNTNASLTKMNYTPNEITAYAEMTDGSYGYRLQFASADENTLARYSHLALSTKGLTLTKEANPTRYTLSGITAAHLAGVTEGKAEDLPVKSKTIAELTDDDLYTFVSLKDVQIGINDGAYTNVHDGYQRQYTIDGTNYNPTGALPTAARFDCAPLSFFDKNGDGIRLLINCMVPWRRTGSSVPKGSGTLNGIVVHTELLRYGTGSGFIGRYAIRCLDENDIALQAEKGFAQTLVEWNWSETSKIATNNDGTVAPTSGSGSLYSTIAAKESAPYGITATYTALTSLAAKGSLSNSGMNFMCSSTNSWWNFANDQGEAIISEFSTAGISASNMILAFDMGGGSGSTSTNKFPANWHVEYSLDGVTYTEVVNSDFSVRPLVWWTNTGLYCCPGNADHTIKLPANELCGHDKVYIALRPTNKAYCVGNNNNAEGAENGTLSASLNQAGNVRMSMYSIRYND